MCTHEFQIVDSGLYSDVKNIENIFNPGVTSKGDEDRGLGLYSIKNIIENYKGTISIGSRDGNTCISFSLPILS